MRFDGRGVLSKEAHWRRVSVPHAANARTEITKPYSLGERGAIA